MAIHNELGKDAEQKAREWLESKQYVFKDANFRFGHAEIDLVMEFKGILVFVEVKFRSGTGFGFAEEFVDPTKRKLLVKAADHYIHLKDWHKDIRFDIVGVYKDVHGNLNFRHFEDAFY
jgi:putative endonuclease